MSEEPLSNDDLGILADRYGELKAQMAVLQEQLDMVKDMLIESEQEVIEGDLFRVTVSLVIKGVFDTQRFKVEQPDVYLHYQKVQHCTTVRCGARTGK